MRLARTPASAYFSTVSANFPENNAPAGRWGRWFQDLCEARLLPADLQPRRYLAFVTLGLVAVIGFLDYLLGYEISLGAIYCLPVALATVAQGWRFAVATALASVVIRVAGDVAAGAQYSRWFVPIWNALFSLGVYLVIVWLFATVQKLQAEILERERQRNAGLTAQIAERARLEKVLVEIGERERAIIGRELHDNLGQHLTGTAFAAQVLGEKLQELALPEQKDAWKLVALIEEGIEKTRHLARGLLLQEIGRDGLEEALQGLAAEISGQYAIPCSFRLEGECQVDANGTATHLFCIAQEAVRNAIRHGKALHVEVSLVGQPGSLALTVRDRGIGLSPASDRGKGLGLKIMAHRAQIIGGELSIETPADGGTLVRCRLPAANSFHAN